MLVHGTASLHRTWQSLAPHLEDRFTLHLVDRRGRGSSSDGTGYSIEQEYADIATVVADVARRWEPPVSLVGHSFGGICAFGAALRSPDLGHLILYEGWPSSDPDGTPSPEITDLLDTLLDRGDLDRLLEVFYLEVAAMTADEVAWFRTLPGWWEARLETAPTIPREYRVSVPLDPAAAAAIEVPTLLLVGENSPPELTAGHEAVAASLPDARVEVIEGEQHLAHATDPAGFAARIARFLGNWQ